MRPPRTWIRSTRSVGTTIQLIEVGTVVARNYAEYPIAPSKQINRSRPSALSSVGATCAVCTGAVKVCGENDGFDSCTREQR